MLNGISLGLSQLLMFRLSDLKREDGQGVTEYGIVLAFVAIALAAVLGILHTQIATFIDTVGDDLGNLPGSFERTRADEGARRGRDCGSSHHEYGGEEPFAVRGRARIG